jgi:hypothetical protein
MSLSINAGMPFAISILSAPRCVRVRNMNRNLWRVVPLIFGIASGLLLFGGFVLFPDGPIRECASGYCSKSGSTIPAERYHAFKLWQIALTIGWPVGLIATYLAWRKRPKV